MHQPRVIVTIFFCIAVIALFEFDTVRAFKVSMPAEITSHLFKVFAQSTSSHEYLPIVCTVGKLSSKEIKEKIKLLLTFHPWRIGINRCDFGTENIAYLDSLNDSRIIISTCGNGDGALTRIVSPDNNVTHFVSDNAKGFEMKLLQGNSIPSRRGNKQERIYFLNPDNFSQFDLASVDESMSDHIRNRIVIIGYAGDHAGQAVGVSPSSRITPFNHRFGESHPKPDAYDILISAQIISTIDHQNFINDINPVISTILILALCFINIILIMITRTRWYPLNLFINLTTLIFINLAASFLIVFFFDHHYFIEMDSLTLLLILSTIFAVVYRIFKDAKSNGTANKSDVPQV